MKHNRILSVIAASTLSFLMMSPAQAQLMCRDLYKVSDLVREETTLRISAEQQIREEARALLDEIESYEQTVQKIRQFSGNLERVSVTEQNRRVRELKNMLSWGETSRAIDLYRKTFRDVEVSFYTLERNDKKIKRLQRDMTAGTLEQNAGLTIIAKLKAENEKAYYLFGTSYGEYLQVRALLEEIIADKKDAAKSKVAGKVLEALGSRSMTNLLPDLEMSPARPELKDLKRVFRTTPETVIAKLKSDVKREKRGLLIRLSYSLVDSIYRVMGKALPAKYVEPVTNVVNLSYDNYVHETYVPLIENLTDAKHDVTAQLNQLMRYSSIHDADQFLATFARVTETRDLWVELRRAAEERGKTVPQDKWFSERMASAETVAAKMTPLSLYYVKSGATKTGIVFSSLASGGYMIYSNWTPETTAYLMSLKQSLLVLLGAG